MALKKVCYPERVLIVMNEDGSFKAAHVEDLEVVYDGKEIIAAKQKPARQLEIDTLKGVLGGDAGVAAKAMNQGAALRDLRERVKLAEEALQVAIAKNAEQVKENRRLRGIDG